MILEVRAGTVAPRVPFAAPPRHAELPAQTTMQPLGERLRRLHREPVQVECFGIFSGRLQLLELARRLIANGHHLQSDDVDVRRFGRAEVVGDAQTLTPFLTREVKACDLTRRPIARILVGIIDEEIVPE